MKTSNKLLIIFLSLFYISSLSMSLIMIRTIKSGDMEDIRVFMMEEKVAFDLRENIEDK